MSLFTDILSKLGLVKQPEKPAPAPRPAAAKPAGKQAGIPRARPPQMQARPPQEMPMVDVVSKLEGLAAKNAQKLNWRVSIVDLLKLLDLDSSQEARKQMAIELGCPADKMGDSAAMNTWLHRTVLQKIAENGGNIPRELLN
jgi:hypothetical protein